MNILITGGAGFIGSHLAEACLAAGHVVHVIDDLSTGDSRNLPKGAKLHKMDIRSPRVSAVMEKIKSDYVAHLAAQVSITKSQQDPAEDASINIVGSLNVLQAARVTGVKKFLFVSSAAVYGTEAVPPVSENTPARPQSPYGIAKYTIEQYVAQEKNWVVVVRPANVYGPRQRADGEGGVVAQFSSAVANRQGLRVEGNGEQTRDFLYVSDVAAGMLAALEKGNGLYNLSTNKETSIRSLAQEITSFNPVDIAVTHTAARPLDVQHSALDNSRAKQELGWGPRVELHQGLERTLAWYTDKV